MASSNCETADAGQLKEVEGKLSSVRLQPKGQEQGDSPAVPGKVQPDGAQKAGKDVLGDDMSKVVDDGTASVTETTNLHGHPLPNSQLHRNKGDNPDLHVDGDNSVDGTNTAKVECFVAKDRDVCGATSNAVVPLILPEAQVDGHQVSIKESSVGIQHSKEEKQNEEKSENVFNEDGCEDVSANGKLVGENREIPVSLSNSRDEHLEQCTIPAEEPEEENHTGDARTYMVICWENEEAEGSRLKSENLSLLSDHRGIANSNDSSGSAAKTDLLCMDENVYSETNDRNSSANTEAEQADLETKESTRHIVNDGEQRVENSEEGVNRVQTREFKGEDITAGKVQLTFSNDKENNAKELNSDDELYRFPAGDTKYVRNEGTPETNIPRNVKTKSFRSTLSVPSKKSSRIKMVKTLRLLPGRSYNELLRKTREKSGVEVEVVEEEDHGQRQSGSQGAADCDRKSSQRKRWKRKRKQNGENKNLDEDIADEEHAEKHKNFDDGSVDEDSAVPSYRTLKQKKKGRKKNRKNRKEAGNTFQEQSVENDPGEHDYGYSLRYVYYDTCARNEDFVTAKQEQPCGGHYHQRFEEDQISDHSYRGHRHQERGRGHEKGCKHGTREFRRSKTERSDSGNQGHERPGDYSAQEFRRSGSSVSESSTQSGQMYGEGMNRSRDTGQHFLNLTITACGDGTRHVETAESIDGYSSFVNSVGSGAGREGKKKKKKKQPRQQDEFPQVHDQIYYPCTQPEDEQGAGGFIDGTEYQNSLQRTVCVKSNPSELGRHRNRKSKEKLERNEKQTDGSAIKGEYSKLLQQCKQGIDTNYQELFSKSTEISSFDDSQRPQTSKKHKRKQKHPHSRNADDRLDSFSYQHSHEHDEDVQLTAEYDTQEQMENRQDASAGNRSSPGRADQKSDRQRGRDGGRPCGGSGSQDGRGHEMEHYQGGDDSHRRGGKRNVSHGGGQNLNNPNQGCRSSNPRSHRSGPRQIHTSQSQGQGQQYLKGFDGQLGQGHEYSLDPRQQRRGGAGRRGGHSDRGHPPDQQHLSQGDTRYSPREPHNFDGHRSGRAGHGHQQGGHTGGQPNQEGQQSNESHQGGHGHKNKRHPRKPKEKYESYWSEEDVSAGLKRGTLIEGPIRVNPRNYNEAYVPLPDGTADVFISGLLNRNRALNGDVVVIQVLEREKWKVFMEDFENMEAKVKPNKGQGDGEHDEDSGPDVVVEEVKVVSKEVKNDEDQREKQKKRTHTPRKTYTSVKEVVSGGSPMAKSLFGPAAGGAGDTGDNMEGVSVQGLLQKTGKVVAVLEMKHSRACSGHIRLMQDKNSDVALFSPTDSRVPRIQIGRKDCPKGFFERPDDYAKTLFIARITEWDENSTFAKGHLARSLGEAGQIEPETEAILIEHNVEFDEFPEEVLKCLPQTLPWTIPASEFEYRRDLRQQCIFTIDPSTARDLDDAMSIEVLEDGRYEVGVHIADVSFFLEELTPLDVKAAGRATSVYLVQKVIPMLPRLLCEELCSLNPDEDRLSFSVIWKMDEHGEIEDEWFGRTVIRSCVKLSYDHAQGFIMEPDREWRAEELPPISGGVSVDNVKKRVLQLDKIAKCLRKKRFDSGALRLDQVKLSFSLDSETGMPNGYFVYEQKDSNRLIEEFMLLANMAVAHRIYDKYPEKALLRRHPPPQNKMVDDLKDLCEQLGLALDLSNSRTWQQSLNNYQGSDELSAARMQVLVALSSKPMQNAKYFCSGMIDDPEVYRHYALNVPLYTHFTSPIRRYADVMVHRLLAASLDYSEMTSKDRHQLHKQAEHCNDKKYMSKRVQEMSSELFFAAFVKEAGPFEEKAMVMGVMDHSFDVFILKFGIAKRVYCDQLDLKSKIYTRDHKKPQLTLVWKSNSTHEEITQTITIFTSVIINMLGDKDPLRWKVLLKRPTSDS